MQTFLELQHAVDHRVLGTRLFASRSRQEQNRATGEGGMALQFGHEGFDIEIALPSFARVEQSIEDEDARFLARQFATQCRYEGSKAFFPQRAKEADVGQFAADTRGVVEVERRQRLEQ